MKSILFEEKLKYVKQFTYFAKIHDKIIFSR
jgi:hypothetical protein